MRTSVFKSSNFLIGFAVCIFAFTNCDKVTHPIQSAGQNVDTVKLVRKVLVEDYTGHQCGNCPPAAVAINDLETSYHEKVVPIAVHAGFYARTSGEFLTSYTTSIGNDWDGSVGFNISAGAGNPNGMVNRKSFQGALVQGISKWSSAVSESFNNDPYILGFTLTPTYDPSTRILNTSVKSKFKASYTNTVNITMVLTEDSIVGPQKDYSKNPDKIPSYVFMHMLRDGINGSWGTLLKAGPVNANDSTTVSFNNFSVKPAFNDKQLYIVAFASDAATHEVLQAERVKLRK